VKIVVVGTGYVGLVTGTCLAESGNRVACVDVDARKIEILNSGGVPIYEPGLEELIRRNVHQGRLAFTTSLPEAMEGADVAFIAVGTPPGETGEADLSHVLEAATQIGRCLKKYAVVVNKSTVPVGSAEKVAEAIRRVTQVPFDVVSNPEFLKEGSAIDDFTRPDRLVVGSDSERARAVMAELYAPFVRTEQPILFMDARSSELTKYAANAMLATRISFMNDISALCERVGASVDHVRRGMGSDKRIGYPFLFPGVGFGGSCLAGRETVLVRQEGGTRLVTLEQLFRELAEDPEVAGSEAPAALHPKGLEVLGWRPSARTPEFLAVAAATRRPFQGEATLVRTKMGRRLLCTPDHPFVVASKDGGAFSVKPAAHLGPRDWIPVAQGAPPAAAKRARVLDLLAGMEPIGLEPANVIIHPSVESTEQLRALGNGGVRAAIAPLAHPRGARHRTYDILRSGALRMPEMAAVGLPLEGASASTVKNGTRVPTSLVADEPFWRVVGLYLAEGHCTADGRRRRLYWSFHPTREAALVRDVADYWERLGVKADVRRRSTSATVSVSSRLLAGFWLDVLGLGGDCYSHRIPDLAWEEPESHKRALLAGLWLGDGSWSLVGGGPSVVLEYGTASPPLADGVLRLLGDLGVMARLKVGRTAMSTVDTHWIVIAGADQVERLLDLVPGADRVGIRSSLARQKKRIAPTGYVRRSEGAALVRVSKVEKSPMSGFVYSLEVPGAQTFVTSGGLVVHNCFPKDVRAVMTMARQVGLDFDLLRGVERVNERQKRLLVEKAVKHFGSLAGKTFGVWGLAFKPKTDDMREAPSVTIIEGLVGNGASVRAHDPVAAEVARRVLSDRVQVVADPYEAAQGADALFLVTEWNEFRQPDFERLKRVMRGSVVFDGRNIWDPGKLRSLGFTYYGVGRGNDGAAPGA
jgi:UDPglucose 6-dehydrogenase